MKLNEIEKILIEGGIEPNEAKIEAKMLVKHFGVSDTDLILNSVIDDEIGREATALAQLRALKRIPIQHIIGEAYFMGENFIVNEHVLIPRDETEILVRKAVEVINAKCKAQNVKRGQDAWMCRCVEDNNSNASTPLRIYSSDNSSPPHPLTSSPNKILRVLDIGTGSGCIACMIAKLTEAQVIGIDISNEALSTALDNSSKMGVFNKAIFRKSDIFSNVKEKFDLIISNPPYIPLKEKKTLQIEVGFEPEGALFASDDEGIEFYEKIITQSSEFLNECGVLMFELGVGQAKKVKELMEKSGFKNIGIEKDLVGIERVIWGER